MLPLEIVINAVREWAGVHVSSEYPRPFPDLFIRVDSGAPVALSPVSDRTMIIVQVYGANLEDVLGLIGQARRFMRDEIPILEPDVSGWDEESGPHEFEDPDYPDWHRWQLAGLLYTTSPF